MQGSEEEEDEGKEPMTRAEANSLSADVSGSSFPCVSENISSCLFSSLVSRSPANGLTQQPEH